MYLAKAVKKIMNQKKRQIEQENKLKARKQSAKFYITALDSNPTLHPSTSDPNELTQEERERVIEILLSQNKVI